MSSGLHISANIETIYPLQGDILSMKEINGLLSTCKALTTAYHSSINFARAIHEAQIEVGSLVNTIGDVGTNGDAGNAIL